MTYPGHRRDTVSRIRSQENAVVGHPFWGVVSVPEICAEAAKYERQTVRKFAVAYLSNEILKTPIITQGRSLERLVDGTSQRRCS